MDCWETLDLSPTEDRRAIKRAYSRLIKRHRPDDDAEAFQRIRAAYQQALELAEYYEADGAEVYAISYPEPDDEPAPVEAAALAAPADEAASDRGPEAARRGESGREAAAPMNRGSGEVADRDLAASPSGSLGADAAETIEQLVSDLVTAGAAADGDDAIEAFEELAARCREETLDFAREVEGTLFFALSEFDAPVYPGPFFAHVVDHYGWDNAIDLVQRHPYELGRLLERIHSNLTHRQLEERSDSKPSSEVPRARIAALRALLGHTDASKRRWLVFRSGPLRQMRALFADLDENCPVIFEHELDSEAARWWRAAIASHHFTVRHLWAGLLVGVLFLAPLLEATRPLFEALTTNAYALVVLPLLTVASLLAASTGILYLLDRLRYATWRRLRPALVDGLARWRANRGLMRGAYWGAHGLALSCYWLPSGFSHLAVAIGIVALFLVMDSATYALLFWAVLLLFAEVATELRYLDGFEYTGSHLLIWMLVATWGLRAWVRLVSMLPARIGLALESSGTVALLGVSAVCGAVFWVMLGVFENCLFGWLDCAG